MRGPALTIRAPNVRAVLRDWPTTMLVVLSIALAIAVNSTVVSLLEALLYPKMDMAAPDRLYWVNFYGDFRHRLTAVRRDSVLLSHGAGFTVATLQWGARNAAVLENGERLTPVTSASVGPDFFEVAGITPLLGRVLAAQDTSANPPAVVLSQPAASELFGSVSPIDQLISYAGRPRRVVGVLGDRADFPNSTTGVWTLRRELPETNYDRVLRIRAGYTRRDVELSLDTAAREVAAIVDEAPSLVSFRLRPAVTTQFRYQNFHYAIAVACLALLLIACANAANLELGRAIGRRRELAIRSALGASPFTLICEVLKEEALIAAVAAGVALALTYAASRIVYTLVPANIGEFVVEPHVGYRVVTFAAIIAVVATLLVGCAPALSAAGADPQDALKDAAGTGKSHRRYYAVLVAVQLGLAIALCCGGVVMLRATIAVDAQPLGFDVTNRITGSLTQDKMSTAREGMEELKRHLASVPGVASAAVTLLVPVRNHSVTVDDSLGALVEVPAPLVHYLVVTPGYFETLGIAVASGGGFASAITDESQVVLDGKSAGRLWPGRDPIGQRLKLGAPSSNLPFARVVGVIADVRDSTKRNLFGPPPPEHTVGGIYYLLGRTDPLANTPDSYRVYGFVARADGDAPRTVLAIKRALVRVDNAAGSRVELMDDELAISRERASRRFLMQLFAFFALCGVALCGIAVVSVSMRSVMERRRELAVRRALGAQTHHILHAVLREMLPVALLGVAFGLALTKYAIPLFGSHALSDDRFNAPLFAVTSVLVLAAISTCLAVPAFRATRVPTGEALRSL